MGRVLDFMGYTWTHAHENENVHQWVIVNMDGQQGYADAQGVYVGYGEYWAFDHIGAVRRKVWKRI